MGRQQGIDEDYVEVKDRILQFREKYPEGSLQQVSVQFLDFGGKSWVVYTAAAYRTPDDPRPGHGTAWEPVPGGTNFTRDSELQNCETSAWGRALIAVGAADAKQGVASADEVRSRQQDQQPSAVASPTEKNYDALRALLDEAKVDDQQLGELCLLLSGGERKDVLQLQPREFWALRNVAGWIKGEKVETQYDDKGRLSLVKDGKPVDPVKIVEAAA